MGVASLTRNHVSGIQGVIIFDEAEATHELDFGDLSSSMFGEMGLDIGLVGCCGKPLVSCGLYANPRTVAGDPASSFPLRDVARSSRSGRGRAALGLSWGK